MTGRQPWGSSQWCPPPPHSVDERKCKPSEDRRVRKLVRQIGRNSNLLFLPFSDNFKFTIFSCRTINFNFTNLCFSKEGYLFSHLNSLIVFGSNTQIEKLIRYVKWEVPKAGMCVCFLIVTRESYLYVLSKRWTSLKPRAAAMVESLSKIASGSCSTCLGITRRIR